MANEGRQDSDRILSAASMTLVQTIHESGSRAVVAHLEQVARKGRSRFDFSIQARQDICPTFPFHITAQDDSCVAEFKQDCRAHLIMVYVVRFPFLVNTCSILIDESCEVIREALFVAYFLEVPVRTYPLFRVTFPR